MEQSLKNTTEVLERTMAEYKKYKLKHFFISFLKFSVFMSCIFALATFFFVSGISKEKNTFIQSVVQYYPIFLLMLVFLVVICLMNYFSNMAYQSFVKSNYIDGKTEIPLLDVLTFINLKEGFALEEASMIAKRELLKKKFSYIGSNVYIGLDNDKIKSSDEKNKLIAEKFDNGSIMVTSNEALDYLIN